jgi:hypothetical protein
LADLGVELFHIRFLGFYAILEDLRGSFQELFLSLCILVRMNLEE